MRILVISNLYPPTVIGGYEISCAQVVESLKQRGHEVKVLTSIPAVLPDPNDNVERMLRLTDVFSPDRPNVRSNLWELDGHLIDSGNIFQLLQVLTSFSPDVCYLWNLIGIGGIGLVACLEYTATPWVWQLGDAVPAQLCIFAGSVLPIAQEMSRRLTGRFVAVSRGLVNEVEHVVSLGGRVRIVPNWVVEAPGPPRRSYYKGGILKIIFVGQINQEKGAGIIVETAAELRRRGYHNFTIDLFGRGDLQGTHRRISGTGVQEAVHLRGWLARSLLGTELLTHDIFIYPTWSREPFAIAPLEAAAHGCVPLITSPSGPAEWLIGGVDCLKAARTSEAFADVIGQVLNKGLDLEPLGRRAAAVIQRDFSLTRVLPALEEELVAACREQRPGGDVRTAFRLAVIADALARSAINEPTAQA